MVVPPHMISTGNVSGRASTAGVRSVDEFRGAGGEEFRPDQSRNGSRDGSVSSVVQRARSTTQPETKTPPPMRSRPSTSPQMEARVSDASLPPQEDLRATPPRDPLSETEDHAPLIVAYESDANESQSIVKGGEEDRYVIPQHVDIPDEESASAIFEDKEEVIEDTN